MTGSDKSNNLKVLALVLPLLAVVVVSGCTSSGGFLTGNGVVINVFEPTLSDVYSEQELQFILEIENQGEARAENIEAKIFGINAWDWDINENVNLPDLLGIDSVNQIAGGTKQYIWTNAEAPKLTRGQSFTYTPNVRVYYDYTTSAYKPITIVDLEEMIRLIQEGDYILTDATTYTSGPLSVDIRTGEYAISDTYSDYTFNLHIRITDLLWGSNGRIADHNEGESNFGDSDDLYPLEISITLPDELNFASRGWLDDGCSGSWDHITLLTDGTAQITCELEVADEPDIRTEGLIMVDLQYRYGIDASTRVTVTGIEPL